MSVLRLRQSTNSLSFSHLLTSLSKHMWLLGSLFVLVLMPLSVTAQSSEKAVSFDRAQIEQRLSKLGMTITNIQPSPINGLIEVETQGGIVFTSANGDHFIVGSLYSLDKNGGYKDVIAERQAPIHAKKIEAFKDSAIEYKADNEKYVVTVFTDTSCGYCVRLHSQMKGYNDLGITVRYLAFPRKGSDSDISAQMAKIWCAQDPQKTLSDVMLNGMSAVAKNDLAECKKSIAAQYELGNQLNVTGTPALFLSSGEMVGGYLEPARLYQRLQQTIQPAK